MVNLIINIFSALGTVSAAVFAAVALWQNRNMKKREEELREQEQANNVSCWLTGKPVEQQAGQINSYVLTQALVKNNSELPIYDAVLLVVDSKSEEEFASKSAEYLMLKERILPGETTLVLPTPGPAMGGRHPELAIVFRDINGIFWYRSWKGKLCKLKYKGKQDIYTALNFETFGPFYDEICLYKNEKEQKTAYSMLGFLNSKRKETNAED